MEGSNRIDCDFLPKKKDGSTQKSNGLRRTCIGTLPNTIIFHLKRFGLDYETFESYKINSYCEFPDVLDMKKYTAKYLAKQEDKKAPPTEGKQEEQEDRRVCPWRRGDGTGKRQSVVGPVKGRWR